MLVLLLSISGSQEAMRRAGRSVYATGRECGPGKAINSSPSRPISHIIPPSIIQSIMVFHLTPPAVRSPPVYLHELFPVPSL